MADAAAESLPPWLVPMVRVVPGDRVVPTTGVSLGQGRVLVPGEFATHDQPLYALDGGADLLRHGRPATVSRRLRLAGLALLDVPGLQRPAPDLARTAPADGAVVELLAFPPPELIQSGTGAVRARAGVQRAPDGELSVAPQRPLPNLTGVLVNACGQWLGHSAARGMASMATGRRTHYRWLPDLEADLAALDVNLVASPCGRTLSFPKPPPAEERPPVVEAPPSGEPPLSEERTSTEDPAMPEASVTTEEPVPAETPDTADAPEPDPAPLNPLPPAESEAAGGDAASGGGPPAWLSVVLVLLVALGAAVIGVVWRRRAGSAGAPVETVKAETPWLRLEGAGAGASVPLRNGRVDAVIGRFDADVLLAGKSVSRRHARLHGTPEGLFLTDLDSTNGTWVNGQRCPPGEDVPVTFGDELRLGELACRLAPYRSPDP